MYRKTAMQSVPKGEYKRLTEMYGRIEELAGMAGVSVQKFQEFLNGSIQVRMGPCGSIKSIISGKTKNDKLEEAKFDEIYG